MLQTVQFAVELLSTLVWNHCPVCRGISVQFGLEYAHLRTPEEMSLYLAACIEESGGDAAFIAKALDDIERAKEIRKR